MNTCQQCGKPYQAKLKRSKYCSGACRAKASRAAHGAIVDDQTAATVRRNATKADQRFERTCSMCGQPFTVNGKQGRRMYCGSRCKKRAFNVAHRTGSLDSVLVPISTALRAESSPLGGKIS